MTIMIAGLVLFLGIHLVPTAPALRARRVAQLGDKRYRGLFAIALVSALRRGSAKAFIPEWKHDLIAVAASLGISYLTIRFHPVIFGTGPVA